MVKLNSILLIILFIFHKQRVVVIRRILFIIAVLYLFRTFSLLFTQLPSAYSDNITRCSPQESNISFEKFLQRIFVQTTNFGFQVFFYNKNENYDFIKKYNYCTDLVKN